MSNSHPFFVEVRRSSGQKEWMAIEKLEALNKQRSFKRKKYKKPIKHGWNGVMMSLCFSALLLIPFWGCLDQFFSWIDTLNQARSKGLMLPEPAAVLIHAIPSHLLFSRHTIL